LKENILQRSRRKSAIGAKAVAAFTYFVTVHPDGIIFNVLIPNMSRSRDLNQDTIFAGLIALPLVAWVVGTTSYLVSRGITAYVNHKKSTQFEREYFPRITYGSAAIQRAFR
jgi:hypothetical protein